MADTAFEARHTGAGLTLVTDAGVSTVAIAVGLGRVMLAASQARGGTADFDLDPVDARHLSERLQLAAAEAESVAASRAEESA